MTTLPRPRSKGRRGAPPWSRTGTPRRGGSAAALRAAALRAGVAALATVAVLAACGVAGAPTADTDHDLGLGLVWAGPANAEPEPFRAHDDDCASADASVPAGGETVRLTLLADDCEQSTRPPINGSHGRYRTPPPFADHVTAAGEVPAGTLTTFAQLYSEYTNSRKDYTDTVGLVRLAHVDGFAVLLVRHTGRSGDADTSLVTAVACAIRPAGTPRDGTRCPASR